MGLRPTALRRVCSQAGDGAVGHALDAARGEHRTGVARLLRKFELDVRRAGVGAFDAGDGLLRLQRAEARSRQIARDAAHAGAVRPVRRQLHLEHRIGEPHHVDVTLADVAGHVGGELDDAGSFGGQFKLGGRAHHAVRHDAAHGLLLERDLRAGNVSAERCEHAEETGARVGGPAHHFEQRRALLHLDLNDLQLVGIGMLAGLDDARDAKRRQLVGRIVDALDLQPDRRQPRRDLIDRRLRPQVILEPGQREFHLFGPQRS